MLLGLDSPLLLALHQMQQFKSRRFGPDAEADTGGGEPASRVGHVESNVLGAVVKLRFALQGLVSELNPEPLW